MRKIIKDLICKLYYKYYFTSETQSSLFITYYVPGIVNNGPAGTYVFGLIDEKLKKIDPILDVVKWNPIAGVNGGEIKLK